MKSFKLMLSTLLAIVFPVVSFSGVPTVILQPDHGVSHPLYAGLTIGYGTTTWYGLLASNDEAYAMSSSVPSSVNEGGTIGGAFVGYELFPSFALEFSYTHYANVKMYFDQFSFVTDDYNISSMVTRTNNYSLVGKFMVPVPYLHNARIFSSVGPAVTHRQDVIYDHWQLTPAFNFGFDIDVTEHIVAEIGANYTAGTAVSELDPVVDYIPFLYSGFARLAWRF